MPTTKAIKCPKCAAPLQFNGGGRVKSITCAYCKSILDIDNEFAILGNFKNTQHDHEVPFKIGMQGVIESIEYTIIGRVTYTEIYQEYFWDDFLLFSPLYGYAWLTYEEGHISYAKRERHLPLLVWDDMNRIESIRLHEHEYKVQPPYTAKISYIEGELTWVAKKYDKVKIIDMYAPPLGISMERTKNEIEFYGSKYLESSMVYDAFDVPEDERVKNNGVHELIAFGEDFFKPFLKISSIALGILLTILFLFYITNEGRAVTTLFGTNLQESSKNFTIKSEKYLSTLKLVAKSKKALNNFNITIQQKEEKLFSINRTISYISPKISSSKHLNLPTWESDAKQVLVYLNLPKGSYTLTIAPINSSLNSKLFAEVREEVIRLNYFVWTILLILGVWGIYGLKKYHYEQQLEEEEKSIFISFAQYFFFYPLLGWFLLSSLIKIFNLIIGI